MEVHAHSHTPRKKWTHYFWEFLMLFLAVFCGFLAEYKLEHMIEHNKEKEYMRSMLEDLRQDTTELNRTVASITVFNNKSNDILDLLETSQFMQGDSLKKLYTLHYSLGAELASLSQRTIAQLKNSGGLRLIRSKPVADTITLYDNRSQYLGAIFKSYDETSTATYNEGMGIFDNKYIRNRFKNETVTLLTDDLNTIRRYANSIYTFRGVGYYYAMNLQQQKLLAAGLINLIKSEYRLN